MIKVIQHLRRRGILRLPRLPRIDHQPLVRILHRSLAHLYPVRRRRESELGVAVVDGGEVTPNDGKLRVERRIVSGHFEEAEVEEGDGGVAPARDEHEGGLGSCAGGGRAFFSVKEGERRRLVEKGVGSGGRGKGAQGGGDPERSSALE